MPRDSSGNYTLPLGNPVIDGTIIDTNWANPTMSDIAVQLNNVLTRDSLLGPTLPFYSVDGTPALPGLSFASQHGTGLWKDPTQVGISYQGVTRQVWNSTGSTITGNFTPSGSIGLLDGQGLNWGDGTVSIVGNSSTDILQFVTNGIAHMQLGALGKLLVGSGFTSAPGDITIQGAGFVSFAAHNGTNYAFLGSDPTNTYIGSSSTQSIQLQINGIARYETLNSGFHAWHNASAVTMTLDATGILSTAGAGRFADGTPALPGVSFGAQTGSGMWRDGTQLGFSYNGVNTLFLSPTAMFPVGNVGLVDDKFLSWGDASARIVGNSATDLLRFFTNGNEAMRIFPGGEVSVGGTTNSGTLTVNRVGFGSIAVHNGTNYTFLGGDSTNTYMGSSSTQAINFQINATNRYQIFSSGAQIWSNAANELMRIDSVRWVGINMGGTAAFNSAVGALNVQVNGGPAVTMRYGGGGAGRFWGIGPDAADAFTVYNNVNVGMYMVYGATAWTATSDDTLKTDFVEFANAVDKVVTLRSGTGRYLTDEEGTQRSFLIAQDVQAILPSAVSEVPGQPEKLGLAYQDVIPLLVAAIKELNARLVALGG